ncbi:MAG: glycosyltransferase [Candidatus Omnitrophica bacterium]|nr:glycosyltransferase [Candidatus Omnitrophota bacterium]
MIQRRPLTEVPLSFCIITGGQRPELIRRVIASIRAQDIPVFEIIVAGQYRSETGIRYVPGEKEARECRRGALRNLGAAQARFEHIVFLDDDCLLAPDWFRSLATCAFNVDLLTFQMRCVDGTRYWDYATVGGPRGQRILDESESEDEFVYATAGAVLIRKAVLETVPWDSQTVFGEDLTISRECQARGFKISHHHPSCVFHADGTYTSVGRVVFRREQGLTQAWVLNAIADLQPAQIGLVSEFMLAQGRAAEAADCLRIGIEKNPRSIPLLQRWEKLRDSLGGKLADDRWSAMGDSTLLAGLEKSDSASAEGVQAGFLAQLGMAREASPALSVLAWPETAMPVRCLGPFFAGTSEAQLAIKRVLELAGRLRLGLHHQGPFAKDWALELPEAKRQILTGLCDAFFSISEGVTVSFGSVIGLVVPPDAEYRVGCAIAEVTPLTEQRVTDLNCMDEVWVPSDSARETLAQNGVEPDKLVVVNGLVEELSSASDQIIARLEAIHRKISIPALPSAPVKRLGEGQCTAVSAPARERSQGAPVSSGSVHWRAAVQSGAEGQKGRLEIVRLSWEGSYLDLGSLSHVNRELTRCLEHQPRIELTRVASGQVAADLSRFPSLRTLASVLKAQPPGNIEVTVRHQWPPNLHRPLAGAWVVVQPWEYGALPASWIPAMRKAAQIWVYSEYARRVYVDSGIHPAKVRVVPLGIDPGRFHPNVPGLQLPTKRRFKFLFVGGTIHRKGADVLLETYLRTFTAHDDVCLVIKDFGGQTFYAGQRLEARIKAAQAEPGAPEILYLTEEMSPEAMAGLLTACDCLVHPYRGEGFGLPVLEAMACGLPVIVTGGGATDDFADDTHAYRIPAVRRNIGTRVSNLTLVHSGWLLEPEATALSERMTWVFHNQEEARDKGRAASDYARREWTWERAAEVAARHLRDLVAKNKAEASAIAERQTRKAKPLVLPAAAKVGLLNEARALFQRQSYTEAWNATLDALKRRPFHPEAHLLLAEIARAAGDSVGARLCAQRARDLAPGWKPARQFLKLAFKGTVKHEWLVLPEQIAEPRSAMPLRLTVCLIVKNEERFIGRCLESVRGLAHQIVVVDTGSADRTMEIALEHGAEVYPAEWYDDFSAARNAALEHADGDWILFLDADEELTVEGRKRLIDEIKETAVLAYRLPIVDHGKEDEGCSYVPRLFRNAPGLFYVGRVHEQIYSSLEVRRQEWGLANRLGTAVLLHHGYASDVVKSRNKIERNLRLLERAVEELPNEPNLVMNHGLELVRSGQLEAGIERYWEAFHLMSALPREQRVPELCETLLTQMCTHLMAARQYEEIVGLLQSPLAKSTGLTASMHFALGLACLELQQFRAWAEHMRLCLAARDRPALVPVNRDIRKAAPRHCLAVCLAHLKETEAALETFRAALKEAPQSHPLRFDYARFLAGQNQQIEALQILHALVTEKPDEPAVWFTGGQIALEHPEFYKVAQDWTFEAHRHFPHHTAIVAQRAEALVLSGNCPEALSLWHQLPEPMPAQPLAALILCETVAGQNRTLPALQIEPEVSRQFLEWYQRLIRYGAQETVTEINAKIESLRHVLPSAARMLMAAMKEAAQEPRFDERVLATA